MNLQDPDSIRMIFIGILLIPVLILTGDQILWRGAVLLGGLALIVAHPIPGILLLVVIAAWRPIRFILEALAAGFFGGLGARLSGVFSSPERAERERERWVSRRDRRITRGRGAPRARGRRPQQYFPFDDGVDHLGE